MSCAAPDVNPIDWLLGVVEKLRSVDRDDAALLETVVWGHINFGYSIDHGLGLSGPGHSQRRNFLRRERNRHIVEALQYVGGDYAVLLVEIKIYESCYRSAWQHRPDPAPEWAPVRAEIHLAFRAYGSVPASGPGLKKVVAEHTDTPPIEFLGVD